MERHRQPFVAGFVPPIRQHSPYPYHELEHQEATTETAPTSPTPPQATNSSQSSPKRGPFVQLTTLLVIALVAFLLTVAFFWMMMQANLLRKRSPVNPTPLEPKPSIEPLETKPIEVVPVEDESIRLLFDEVASQSATESSRPTQPPQSTPSASPTTTVTLEPVDLPLSPSPAAVLP